MQYSTQLAAQYWSTFIRRAPAAAAWRRAKDGQRNFNIGLNTVCFGLFAITLWLVVPSTRQLFDRLPSRQPRVFAIYTIRLSLQAAELQRPMSLAGPTSTRARQRRPAASDAWRLL
jgi:hypothetical protein